MDVSILIVSFNTRELTLACLRSIYHQTEGLDFEVIVVDNRSDDGSADAIASGFPMVRLIRADENLGFARANNLAAGHAAGEYLLLLNPDTVVLDGAVRKVWEFARLHQTSGIIGGRTFFADGSLNYDSCHGRPTPWSLWCIGTGLAVAFRGSRWLNPEALGSWERDSIAEVDAVTGCFLLIRRRLWEELRGFDERYFMYGEDTDLCLRARRAGNVCMVCPDARLIHYGGASERVRAEKMIRLFHAKAQLMRAHWSSGWVWFGLRMLDLWALSRYAATGILRWFDHRYDPAHDAWRDVWLGRRRFHAGARRLSSEPDTAPLLVRSIAK